MDTGKSALGLDGNVAAALGYPIGIIAIISLIMEKENRFVKFHALQSILLHVGFWIVMMAAWFLVIILAIGGAAAGAATNSGAVGGLFGSLGGLLIFALFVAYVAALIFAAVKSYGGAMFKLPIIGGMADKWIK
jgi:uncharacterized membrane protein